MLTPTQSMPVQSLIGKTITADGWLRDNSGLISGKITEVTPKYGGLEWIVRVDPDSAASMETFTFTAQAMATLISDGKLPEANRLLNSGTNARIMD